MIYLQRYVCSTVITTPKRGWLEDLTLCLRKLSNQSLSGSCVLIWCWSSQTTGHWVISYHSAQATIKKYHRLGGLNSRHLFLTALEAGSPRSGCQPVWILVRTLFLVCRQPPSCCVFTWPFLGVYRVREREKEIFFLWGHQSYQSPIYLWPH